MVKLTPQMDAERLRSLFGKFGDRREFLEWMYGPAYLDHRDDTNEGIYPDLEEVFSEGNVANVRPLIGRAIELIPEVTCEENQSILLRYLRGFIRGDIDTTFEEIFSTWKHRQSCTNNKCTRLDHIVTLDRHFTPEEMKVTFGKEIEQGEIE